MSAERRAAIDVTSEDGESLGSVTASVLEAPRARELVVIAHGAGGTMETPSIVALQRGLEASGISAVRFNFLYAERGRRAPIDNPR